MPAVTEELRDTTSMIEAVTILTPFSISPMTDASVDALPNLLTTYCAIDHFFFLTASFYFHFFLVDFFFDTMTDPLWITLTDTMTDPLWITLIDTCIILNRSRLDQVHLYYLYCAAAYGSDLKLDFVLQSYLLHHCLHKPSTLSCEPPDPRILPIFTRYVLRNVAIDLKPSRRQILRQQTKEASDVHGPSGTVD